MRIEGLNVANAQNGSFNKNMKTDSFSKNIQNQIANAQKQLQELSANETMNAEEKMKKRQEIQQQITDLNNQLRQHQIEQRKEKQQAKFTSNDNMISSKKSENQSIGLSQASMTAMISADSAISTARVQNSVATKLETRAGVLETEIKLDASRGGSVEAKMEELAEVKQRVSEIESGQMGNLADVNNQIERIDEDVNVSDNKREKNEDDTKVKNNTEDVVQEELSYKYIDVRI